MTLPSPDSVLLDDALLVAIGSSLETQTRNGVLSTSSIRQTINLMLERYYPEIAGETAATYPNYQENTVWTVAAFGLLDSHFSAEFNTAATLTDDEFQASQTVEVTPEGHQWGRALLRSTIEFSEKVTDLAGPLVKVAVPLVLVGGILFLLPKALGSAESLTKAVKA